MNKHELAQQKAKEWLIAIEATANEGEGSFCPDCFFLDIIVNLFDIYTTIANLDEEEVQAILTAMDATRKKPTIN